MAENANAPAEDILPLVHPRDSTHYPFKEGHMRRYKWKKAGAKLLLYTYVGACWYEYQGKRLDQSELQMLIGDLAGGHVNRIPSFALDFLNGFNSRLTVDVRRVAELRKEELLRKIDEVWRNPPDTTLKDLESKQRPSLGDEYLTAHECAILYASIHWVVDEAGVPFPPSTIRQVIYDWLELKPKEEEKRRDAFWALKDNRRTATVKIAMYSKRCRERLVEECLEIFKEAGYDAREDGVNW